MREGGAGRRVGRARSAPAPARRRGGGASVGAARRQGARAGGSAHVRGWGRVGGGKGACAPSGPTAGAGRGVTGELASSARPTRRWPGRAGERAGGAKSRARGRKGAGLTAPLGACAVTERGGWGGRGGELGDAVAARGMNVGMLSLGRE